MMPTFPRSPLSFRTAGFPGYGWKAGFSGGAFRVRLSAKACSRHPLIDVRLPSPFVHRVANIGYPVLSRAVGSMMHRHGGWGTLRPRGPRSGLGYAVPAHHRLIDPIRPARRHIATSPHCGLYAMPSLCGSA